jgi:hypothetical protein
LALGLRLVKNDIVDIEVGHIAHVERHDMVVSGTDIVVGYPTTAIDLRVTSRLHFLDHFENVTHFGRVKRSTRKYACILLTVLQCDVTRVAL